MTCPHYQSKGAFPEHRQWFIECDGVRRYFPTPNARDRHVIMYCKDRYHLCGICQGNTQQPGKSKEVTHE